MSVNSLHRVMHQGPAVPQQGAPVLLLLHGYGSNEEDLVGLAPHLNPSLICVCARAPYELPFGGYAWFNIEWGEEGIRFDYDQAWDAVRQVDALVNEIRCDYSPSGIVIAGFSQGAAMALALGLSRPDAFVGVAALSGLCGEELMPSDRESVRGLPVFMSHGCQDEVISIEQVRAAKPLLEDCPVDLTYREYETMGHTIDASCLADLKAWMEDCLPVR